MDFCNATSIPIDSKLNLTCNGNNKNKPVRQLIGCSMYLMLGSRPDMFRSQLFL